MGFQVHSVKGTVVWPGWICAFIFLVICYRKFPVWLNCLCHSLSKKECKTQLKNGWSKNTSVKLIFWMREKKKKDKLLLPFENLALRRTLCQCTCLFIWFISFFLGNTSHQHILRFALKVLVQLRISEWLTIFGESIQINYPAPIYLCEKPFCSCRLNK